MKFFLASFISLLVAVEVISGLPSGISVAVRQVNTDKSFELIVVDPTKLQVDAVKTMVKANWNIPQKRQTLFLGPNLVTLDDGHSLADYNIKDSDIIWVYAEPSNQSKVFIRKIGGNAEIIELPFDESETVASIKSEIEKQWKVPVDEQSLYTGPFDHQLELDDDTRTMGDYRLAGNSKPEWVDYTIWLRVGHQNDNQIFVRTIGGSSQLMSGFVVDPNETTGELKAKIEAKWGIPAPEQSLVYGPDPRPLENSRRLADYNIPTGRTAQPGSTVWLFVRQYKERSIFVRQIGSWFPSKFTRLPYDENEPIESIKSRLVVQLGVAADRQTLYFGPNHRLMEDRHSLGHYNVPGEFSIQPSTTIWLHVRPSK